MAAWKCWKACRLKVLDDQTAATALHNYFRAFSVTSFDERERLVRASVTDDLTFSNPGVYGSGADSLLEHITRFQEKFRNNWFRINWLRVQHGQVLGEWTQINGVGSELVTAHSYARLDESGRISLLAGFWDRF